MESRSNDPVHIRLLIVRFILAKQAFGSDDAFKKMDAVREQQEQLARMHFRLGKALCEFTRYNGGI